MILTYKNNLLYMQVTAQERVELVPMVPRVKLDNATGCWVAPIKTLLPMLYIFPSIECSDAETQVLVQKAQDLINTLEELKGLAKGNRLDMSKSKTFLMQHQVVCNMIAKTRKKFAFFLDTGTGKTITSLSIINDLVTEKDAKFIVICPKSIINTAWVADCKEFYPHLRLLPIKAGTSKWQLEELIKDYGINTTIEPIKDIADLIPHADIIVMNPEQFKKYYSKLPYKRMLDSLDGIVIDESTLIKNRAAAITKLLLQYGQALEYTYLLSGKPAPNSPMDYYTQVQMINPFIFGANFSKFREAYFQQTDFFGYNFKLRDDKKKIFSKLLSLVSIFISKDTCLDLPPKTYEVREVTLSSETKSIYKEMEKTQVALLKDTTIATPNKLGALMKLRQISSGFILDNSEGTVETYKLDKAKISELENILEELGEHKAIIWVNFKEEVAAIEELMLKKHYTYVTAYSGTRDVDASIEAFKNNTAQFIIANPRTLKYGVTFTGNSMKVNCTYAIYYSLSFSYEDYYQSHDRIYRKGQSEPCTFLFILAEGTVDTMIYKCLNDKGTNASLIENLAKGLGDLYD